MIVNYKAVRACFTLGFGDGVIICFLRKIFKCSYEKNWCASGFVARVDERAG